VPIIVIRSESMPTRKLFCEFESFDIWRGHWHWLAIFLNINISNRLVTDLWILAYIGKNIVNKENREFERPKTKTSQFQQRGNHHTHSRTTQLAPAVVKAFKNRFILVIIVNVVTTSSLQKVRLFWRIAPYMMWPKALLAKSVMWNGHYTRVEPYMMWLLRRTAPYVMGPKALPAKRVSREMGILHPDSALCDATLLADSALYDGTKRVGLNSPFYVKLCAGRAFQYTQLFFPPQRPLPPKNVTWNRQFRPKKSYDIGLFPTKRPHIQYTEPTDLVPLPPCFFIVKTLT